MIEGGNWWRANEIVMRHLTRRLETRYRCRDKAGERLRRRETGYRPEIERKRKAKLNRRVRCASAAPTHKRDEECGERPAYGAGQTAKERQCGDRRASIMSEQSS